MDSLTILNCQKKDNVHTLSKISKILINFKTKDSKSLITHLTFLELFLKQRPSILYSVVGKKKVKVGCSVTIRNTCAYNFIGNYINFLFSSDNKKESIGIRRMNDKGILSLPLNNLMNSNIINDEIDKFQFLKEGTIEFYPTLNKNTENLYRLKGIPLENK
jgi:ribosomal protein L5